LRFPVVGMGRLSPRAIVAGTALLVLIMISLFAILIYQERKSVIGNGIEAADNLGLVIERDITRTFQSVHLSLQAVVDNALDPVVRQMSVPYRRQLLFDRSTTSVKFMGAILFVGKDGNIVDDSSGDIPRSGNFSSRDWFEVQRLRDDVGLYISPPQDSLLDDGSRSIALSRRVSDANGKFAGVAVASIELNYFASLTDGLTLGAGGTVSLAQPDGLILMRQPADPAFTQISFKGSDAFERFLRTGESGFFSKSGFDGQRRLHVFRRFIAYPLILGVAPSEDDLLANWRKQTVVLVIFIGLLAAALLALSFLLAQEFRRRLKMEAGLKELSATDGLTGLKNRRDFNQTLHLEWSRMTRSTRPMSLLFIDIDHFKAYNDNYGHLDGDRALIAVAREIARCVWRPSDLVARYGGEEFVVVLPETDSAGALHLAGEILAGIAALDIVHAHSPHGTVSVSIGVATSGRGIDSADRLVQLADSALYAAKHAGRNRAVVAGASAAQAATPVLVD
jgi:diguanylate cyclase (GGDEF)-like protein